MEHIIDNDVFKASYLEEIVSKTQWPSTLSNITDSKKVEIALLIQINLQLTRVFDMLRIATGLTEEYPNDAPSIQENADIHNSTGIDEEIDKALEGAIVCGSCGNGVKPNSLGYCPRCSNDLRNQIARKIY